MTALYTSGRVTAERDNRISKNRELKDFEVLDKLGEGSFGQVHKVRDRISHEICVMKVVPFDSSNPGALNDKLQECSILKNLRHPYICRFKQYFVDQSRLCIIFDYSDKGDLESFIKNQKTFKLSDQ